MTNSTLQEVDSPKASGRRLFLALELDNSVHSKVVEVAQRLQKGAHFTPAKLAWVPPENYHITLYFLGPVPDDTVQKLVDYLPETAAEIPPFDIDVRHIGVFPDEKRVLPKVLWIGVHNPALELLNLRTRCAGLLARVGLPVPPQDFTPHITLARFKSSKGLSAIFSLIETYKYFKAGASPTTKLVLMESITGGGPARYQPYATAPLKGVTLHKDCT